MERKVQMKAQGVITVPVQNGKVTKTGRQKNGSSSGNADFIAMMNDLSVFSRNQNSSGSSVKKDDLSGTDSASSVKTSFKSSDMKFKSSYMKDSDSHIINNTAKTSDNSRKSTAAKAPDTDSNTSADKAAKDGSAVQKGKETKSTQKTDKSDNTKKTDSVNRDTGVSGPETEDITVDEEETMEDFSSDILERIKEDLGADDATVLSAMQSLGLSFSDLTVQSNAAQLYMTVTGADQSDLLTSDNFFSFLNDLQSDFSAIPDDILSQMTPVTDDEAQELMSYLNDHMTDEEMTADGTVIEDNLSDVTVLNVETEDTSGADNDTVSDAEEQTLVPDDTVTSDQTTVTDTVQPGQTMSQNSSSDMSESSDMFSNSQKQPETTEINTNAMQANVETATVTENTFSETISQVTKYTDINTDNVIQQIVDKAKQTLGTTVKSLEMELNPQSLGKIYLQVSEKSGDVTAHLYAQNEAVRHALENRLADLQDNLNRQGVRVNEVTISVEPHAFEKNLEQNTNGNLMNNSNAGAFSQREGNAGTAHRTSGTIDVRSGFDGTQTEEDELEASIMRDNGNTVSYLA